MRAVASRFVCALGGLAGLLLVLGLVLAGCKSTPEPKAAESGSAPQSSRLAAVVISGHPAVEIAVAAQQVFLQNGYQKSPAKTCDLLFEKKGSALNTIMYGDWSSKPVWMRVKAYIRDTGIPDQLVLECDAFMVIDRGDQHFEEERALSKVRRGTYQELLEKVKQRLK